MDRIAIIGAQGLGREIRDNCIAAGARSVCFLEKEPATSEFDGVRMLEDTPETVRELVSDGWRLVIGIANPRVRRKIAERYTGLPFVTVIHPSATFGVGQLEQFVRSAGSSVCAGARLSNNITVGDHVVVHANCTIGHDTMLRDFASVMPGVNVSGNVDVGEGAYIGTGAAVINGENDDFIKIGAGATVGAGAVVIRDVPAGATVVGNPAREVRKSQTRTG